MRATFAPGVWLGVAVALASHALGAPQAAADVTFTVDVAAVLSKAGCNQGTCHGNATGKGGFKLSLRGDDPAWDYRVLTREQFGRRVDTASPDESLMLRKALGQSPHEGGRRFAIGSTEHQILRDWIAAGARFDDAGTTPRVERLVVMPRERVLVEPAGDVQIAAQAHFSDGSMRDVTSMAVYDADPAVASVTHDGLVRRAGFGETTVLVRYLGRQAPVRLAFVPARPHFVWNEPPAANYIDELVFAKLRSLRMNPSDAVDDRVFLRRAYLDTLGMLPTAEESEAFLADNAGDKRARLIDRLLERHEFADYWALKWSDLLKNEEKVLDRKGVQAFHRWIRHTIDAGLPLNEFAREIIAARGSTYTTPAANFYRALREPTARSEAAAQVFLGVRLQCARCHNHPFDRWTQDDYYNWASFFARVDYEVLANDRRDDNDKHEFDGEQVVYMARKGEVVNPRTSRPAEPRFLATTVRAADARAVDRDDDRLLRLADWMAADANPFFARVQANRIWYHLMGRGIVEPIDDFRDTNPAVNPPLLDALARDFADGGYDVRRLVRTIMGSRVYALSSSPNETNAGDTTNFSHVVPRPIAAEALLDALSTVLDAPVKFNGYPLGMRATQLPGVQAFSPRSQPPSEAERFLKLFGKPPRLLTCECERTSDTTLGQALALVSGPTVNTMLAQADNRIGRWMADGLSQRDIIERLYLAALCRRPTAEELSAMTRHVESSDDRRAALEDVAWGIVNAKEFVLRY